MKSRCQQSKTGFLILTALLRLLWIINITVCFGGYVNVQLVNQWFNEPKAWVRLHLTL